MFCKAFSLLASISCFTLITFSPVRSNQNDITKIVSGNINGMKIDRYGNLYASVNIKTENGYNKAEIIKWNGNEWSSLNSQISEGTISTFMIDDFGNIYVGGRFKYAGGVEVNGITMWDGNTWKALGTGMRHTEDNIMFVNSIALDDAGNLYAGGSFDFAGNELVNNLAKWDGKTWSNLGNGVSGENGKKGFVNSIVIDEKANIYVSGSFANAGAVEAQNLAKWDGNSWSSIDHIDNQMTDIVKVDSGNFYAVISYSVGVASYGRGAGSSRTMTGVYIQTKDSSWKLLGNMSEQSISNLMFDPEGDLYAMFSNFLSKWDGQKWGVLDGMREVIPVLHSYSIDSLGNIYAAGSGTATTSKTDVFYKWDGKSWEKLSNFTNEQTLIGRLGGSFRKNMKSNSEKRHVIYTIDGRQCYKIQSLNLARGMYIKHHKNKEKSSRRPMIVIK